MTIASRIAPELPFLRRFARALTGSQSAGDARVVSMLEALVDGRAELSASASPRVALYQAFLKVWDSDRGNEPADGQGPQVHAEDRNLGKLSTDARRAFLLVSVEGFGKTDAARILGFSEADVDAQLDAVGREIAEQVATDVLIIEDEPLISMDLKDLVEVLGHRVTGVARTHTEAVTLASTLEPGMILADIKLADGSSGLDAVNEILGKFEVPVLFITAFPERLLTGARPEPAFLITKPFDAAMVRAMVSQALFFDRKSRLTARAR